MKKKNMKSNQTKPEDNVNMESEYDFSKAVRGKHYKNYRKGHVVSVTKAEGKVQTNYFKLEEGAVMLDPEVRKYFPDSEKVNNALRTLIKLIPAGRPATRKTTRKS